MLDVWTNRPTYIYPEVAQLVGGASLRNCTVRVRIPPTGPLYPDIRQFGRRLALGARGWGFKSLYPDHMPRVV